MDFLNIGNSGLVTSRFVYGCMRIVGDHSVDHREKGKEALRAALEEGYTHFDHADIYGDGVCEEVFSEVLMETPGIRDSILITGKCGIRGKGKPHADDPGRYDFSKEYILRSVEGSLSRLGTDYLDFLLLHRPDYLFRAEEVAEVFQILRDSGKVLHFGVSNFRPSQVQLLQSCCSVPLLMHQVEVNIHATHSLEDGTLDQCQELGMTPQAWCPLGGVVYPAWGNTFSEKDETRIAVEFDRQAKKYATEKWIIMLAWLLKHPAMILPIIGSTTPSRIKAASSAFDMEYSREDWYRLLEARNGQQVP